jgi:hypothetical protein
LLLPKDVIEGLQALAAVQLSDMVNLWLALALVCSRLLQLRSWTAQPSSLLLPLLLLVLAAVLVFSAAHCS